MSPSDSDRPADPSADIETALQSLKEAGTGLRIQFLREDSCLARDRVEHPEVKTRWTGEISGQPVSPEETDAALDRMSASLQSAGWELKEDLTDAYPGEIRSVSHKKGDLFATASYQGNGPEGLRVFISTSCWDNPKGHQLLRSELDPDYGTSSSIYSDSN